MDPLWIAVLFMALLAVLGSPVVHLAPGVVGWHASGGLGFITLMLIIVALVRSRPGPLP